MSGEQLSLEMARRAVAEADAKGLGAVAAYARLQLARAAGSEGLGADALTAAVDAIPGMAVAAELGDAGQILRWSGDPSQAWGGLSERSRGAGERRAWMEGGIHALGAALDVACTASAGPLDRLEAALAQAWEHPWIQGSPRWSGVLTHVPDIVAGIRGVSRELGGAHTSDEPDVAIWETLTQAVDVRRSVVQRYAGGLGVVVSLSTGGLDYRPLRQAVGRALHRVWTRTLADQPFLFRQPRLRLQRLEELAPLVNGGDLGATAEMLVVLGDGVAVKLPWELDAWLKAPFEGVQSGAAIEE